MTGTGSTATIAPVMTNASGSAATTTISTAQGAGNEAAGGINRFGKFLKGRLSSAASFLKRKFNPQSEIEEIIQKSANTQPPTNCLALDCEFRLVNVTGPTTSSASATTHSLRQVAIVDSQCTVVLNVYVKDGPDAVKKHDPSAPVSATQVDSVAAAEQLVKNVIKPDTIIIVHDPHQDFVNLNLQPEPANVRDTSLEQLIRRVGKIETGPHRVSLKLIAKKLLNLDIQNTASHDPVEDATATMRCYLAVHWAWEERIKNGTDPTSAKKLRIG